MLIIDAAFVATFGSMRAEILEWSIAMMGISLALYAYARVQGVMK